MLFLGGFCVCVCVLSACGVCCTAPRGHEPLLRMVGEENLLRLPLFFSPLLFLYIHKQKRALCLCSLHIQSNIRVWDGRSCVNFVRIRKLELKLISVISFYYPAPWNNKSVDCTQCWFLLFLTFSNQISSEFNRTGSISSTRLLIFNSVSKEGKDYFVSFGIWWSKRKEMPHGCQKKKKKKIYFVYNPKEKGKKWGGCV